MVARVAEALGVSWNTANNAVLDEGRRVLIGDPARFDGVTVIGVDEHVWRRLQDPAYTLNCEEPGNTNHALIVPGSSLTIQPVRSRSWGSGPTRRGRVLLARNPRST